MTTTCRHNIADVALHRTEMVYIVECQACGDPLGVVTSPHHFQELRREALATRPRAGLRGRGAKEGTDPAPT